MKKYSLFQNILFILKEAWELKKNKLLLYIFIAIIANVGLSLVELFITPQIVKMIELKSDLFTILLFAIGIVLLYFIFESMKKIMGEYMLTPKIDVRTNLINKLVKRNLTMPYPLTLDTKVSQLFKKGQSLVGNNNSFAEKIFDSIVNFISNIIMLVVYVLLLMKLPILLILFTVVTSFISFNLSKKIKDWKFNHAEEENKFFGDAIYVSRKVSNIKSAKDIRMFGLINWIEDIYKSIMFSYDAFLKKYSNKVFYAGLLSAFFDLLRNSITYYYLIDMVISNRIDIAGFILLFTAQGNFSNNILNLFDEAYKFAQYSNDANIFRIFLDYEDPYSLENGMDINSFDVEDLNIELRDVSFKYSESEEYILENINLKIKPKDKIAIVGMNGSGKTTLIKILTGFLEPTEGDVLLNGINIKKYKRKDYYKIFSAVFQDYSLIPDKLKYNITQNTEEFDIEKINKVIELAGLKNKIDSLEKGIETVILKNVYHDGQELSGGEVQKLLLARALYRNSPFLILDEPSAALDPIAERDLYNKYNELTKNSTSIFISHRMASTRFCDYILLIKDKKIYEKGTHDELMKLDGEYKYLFDVQSKYYKEEVL